MRNGQITMTILQDRKDTDIISIPITSSRKWHGDLIVLINGDSFNTKKVKQMCRRV